MKTGTKMKRKKQNKSKQQRITKKKNNERMISATGRQIKGRATGERRI